MKTATKKIQFLQSMIERDKREIGRKKVKKDFFSLLFTPLHGHTLLTKWFSFFFFLFFSFSFLSQLSGNEMKFYLFIYIA